MEPIDNTEPTEPIESTDPFEAIERNESSEAHDQRDDRVFATAPNLVPCLRHRFALSPHGALSPGHSVHWTLHADPA